MAELPDSIHEEIKRLCAAGDALAEERQFSAALKEYWAAWELLPEPKFDWQAATWILGTIGDVNFHSGDYAAGRNNLNNAMICPGGLGNPFLHLRLGQCQFELGNMDLAADDLARAFLDQGNAIFRGEDAKYVEFVKSRLEPPAGGWPEDE